MDSRRHLGVLDDQGGLMAGHDALDVPAGQLEQALDGPLAGLLVVSDELHELKWRHGFGDPRLREGCRLARDVLVDLAASPGQ